MVFKSIFSSLIILSSSHLSLSQNRIIVAPIVNFKTSIAFVDPENLYSLEKNILENQPFYQPYSIAYSSRIVKHQTFGSGISLGYEFKNKTRFLSLSYIDDVANFRAFSSFRPFYSEFHSGYRVNYYGINLHRFQLNYSIKLPSQSKLGNTWFSWGLGTFVNRNRWTSIFPQSWDMPLNTNGDMLLRTYIRPFEENKVNFFLKVGFEHDFNVNKKHIFSLNAYYIQGFGVVSRVEYVHEYTLNGQFKYSGTGLMSRGSGFYWEISRKFQLYPWRPTKKTKLEHE
jgi:hypothetical protein